MDKENKKVNNAENTDSKPKTPLEEISDGFYDLMPPSPQPAPKKKPLTREEELKRKDEERRALEMQAIREDIERRYSQQLESAQSKASSKKKKAPAASTAATEADGREAVKDELERLDSIINGDSAAAAESDKTNPDKKPSKKKKSRKKKAETNKKAEEKAFDLDGANPVYALFYSYGNAICAVLGAVFAAVFGFIKKPFVAFFSFLSKATESTKRKTVKRISNTVSEAAHFRKEIKHAGKSIKRALKKPKTLSKVLVHYIKLAIKRHSGLLKTAANTLLPIGALAVMLITVNYWSSATFALEVIYNDQSIGYISNESVYVEAKSLVKDRLTGSAFSSSTVEETVAAAPNLNASYNLSIVSIDQLNDAQAISDRMIENSVDNLTNACGVYIDGKFICAVKNEADAKTVFYDILEPYEADAELNGYVVGFAENIDYVQGLYRDDSDVMWDASKLSNVLNGEEKLVSIRKIVTTTTIQDIKFDTVKKRDATKYSGYRQVLQKGINGSERVTKTQIYIDGVLQDTDYSYETITEPVDEIVTIGTRTSYGGVYIGEASDSGFLWPAPSCHRVSSPYGWRSSGWHNGIDLVRAGGGASGTPVIASKSGRVEVVQRSNSGYGNMVLINHGDGYKTRYAHMIKGSITVSVGDYVDAGQTIGKVGSTGNSTGPHLHFEVIRNGETQNPKNYIY